jgi:membrane protein YdbS with pleckstrin-like domain
MTEVSTVRLYLMRALYLLICVGMGSQIWPLMFHHAPWDLMHGVACSMLAAMTALMALGVRYPHSAYL